MEDVFMLIIKFYYNFLKTPVLHSYERKVNRSDINIVKNLRTIDGFMNFLVDSIKENGIKKNSNLKNVKIECKKFNIMNKEHYFLYKIIEVMNKKIGDELMESFIITVYDDENVPLFSTHIPYKKISFSVLQSYIKKRGKCI